MSTADIRALTDRILAGERTKFPAELHELARRLIAQPARTLTESEARTWATRLVYK